MEKGILDYLNEYSLKEPVRLHMPGHKGKSLNKAFEDVNKFDITELSFSDNLNNPRDTLLDMLKEISKVYKSKYSFISVNGSSSLILASINALVKEGEKIIFPRNAHISAYNALYFSKAAPIYIYPKNNSFFTFEDYKEIIEKEENVKAVYVTYPDYFGRCLDLKKLCSFFKKRNILVIVDEAHGAHLGFSKEFPINSISAKADISIQSAHKTLYAPNQGALLHVNSDKIDIEKIKLFLKMFQTTSPSYPIILQTYLGVKNISLNGEKFLALYKKWYNTFKAEISKLNSFYFEDEISFDYDIFKLYIKCKENGYEIEKILEEKYNIYLEAAGIDYILAYCGMGSNEKDLILLSKALCEIDKDFSKGTIHKENNAFNIFPKNQISLTIYEGLAKEYESINYINSVDRVCADFIIPYPPGFPLVAPGEVISKEAVEYIQKINGKQEILGIKNSTIKVIK